MNIEQKNRLIALCENMKSYGYTDGVEELKSIFPELRESEDERIRKFLIDILSHGTWRKEWPFSPPECISWLEKQKESLHISETCKENADSFTDEDERIRKEIISFIEHEEALGNIPDGWHQAKRPGEWIAYLEKQKEQKPAEPQDYSGLNDLERAIHRGFLAAGVENVPVTIIKETAKECLAQPKPAEWSAYDKATIEYIIEDIKGLRDDETDEEAIETYDRELNLLESINSSVKLSNYTNPAEWSEVDEKDMAYIIQILYDCYAYKKHNLSKTDYDNLVNKLKSFSSQPKQLKESHKEGFQTARHATALAFMKYCDKIRPNGKMCLSNSECEEIEKAFLVGDWEKIERYFHKYSWKPSEEQMEAFEESLMSVAYTENKTILESLYEQLKAL